VLGEWNWQPISVNFAIEKAGAILTYPKKPKNVLHRLAIRQNDPRVVLTHLLKSALNRPSPDLKPEN
jgi:hypothetical protein